MIFRVRCVVVYLAQLAFSFDAHNTPNINYLEVAIWIEPECELWRWKDEVREVTEIKRKRGVLLEEQSNKFQARWFLSFKLALYWVCDFTLRNNVLLPQSIQSKLKEWFIGFVICVFHHKMHKNQRNSTGGALIHWPIIEEKRRKSADDLWY